jgi:hypothetical protein
MTDTHTSPVTAALLPCPFCGGEAKCSSSRPTGIMGQIYCDGEECFGPRTTAMTKQDSIVQWNTRNGVAQLWQSRADTTNATVTEHCNGYAQGRAPAQLPASPVTALAQRLASEIERYERRPYRTDLDRLSLSLNENEAPLLLELLRSIPAQGSPIPRASGDDAKGGWRLDFKWLQKLSREIESATGYQITIECTQEAVLRAEALLALPSTPSAPGESNCDCPAVEGELTACELLRKQVSRLRAQIESAQRAAWLVLRTTGPVEVDRTTVADFDARRAKLKSETNFATGAYVFEAAFTSTDGGGK